MIQCKVCYRLLPTNTTHCIYCSTDETSMVPLSSGTRNEFYKIDLDKVTLENGTFEILELLGKGGFGTVLKVKSSDSSKEFAMKVPLTFDVHFTNNNAYETETVENSKKYILNEISNIEKFKDPTFLNMVKMGEAAAIKNKEIIYFPVFLMELAICTLHDLITQSSSGDFFLTENEKIKAVLEIVTSICKLHDFQIIHRDLSPDNIFLVEREDRINYVLGDFGASKKLVDSTLSKSSQLVGHQSYIDPELYFNKQFRHDKRIDLYSIGIIVCEIFIGNFWKNLYEEDINLSSSDFEKDVLLKHPEFNKIPDYLKPVIQKAVKRKPDERFKSVHEFRDHLFEALKNNTDIDIWYDGEVKTGVRHKKMDFSFQLQLPLSSQSTTFHQQSVLYKENETIRLNDFRGLRIQFLDFAPLKASILGTKLYSVTTTNDGLLLSFKIRQFREILKKHSVSKELKGVLEFSGTLIAEGEVIEP